MNHDKNKEYCVQDKRITKLENEIEVKKQRLNHYKQAVAELREDVDEVKEHTFRTELKLTQSVDEMKLEIIEIHTTIKNVTYLISAIGGLVAIIIAIPELAHIIMFGIG